MSMGIVNDSDFDSELERLKNPPNHVHTPVVIKDIERGRTPGAVGVPSGLRKIIGDESITNGRQSALELAQGFGISASSVSAYAAGATSTATYDDRPNAATINSAKERISKKARAKLMLSLNHMTADKMDTTNAKDLSSIAKDMSVVIKNMEPPPINNPGMDASKPAFVIYSPQIRQENHFQTVVVKE
jgi:hypothetical protein